LHIYRYTEPNPLNLVAHSATIYIVGAVGPML